MAHIPTQLVSNEATKALKKRSFVLKYQGKVREMWDVPGRPWLLMVASDRISIFDFVLNALIPGKGAILTALTHFWLTKVLNTFANHLIDSPEFSGQNAVHDLIEDFDCVDPKRSLVVRQVEIPPFEMIFRAHLGGSVWKSYQDTGIVAGVELVKGLQKWSLLYPVLFTPSTKVESGHDENITIQQFLDQTDDWGQESINFFMRIFVVAKDYARQRGIAILDTKFEGKDCLADEVLTPDSSRFAAVEELELAIKEKRDPKPFDKQLVRDWGAQVETPEGIGIKCLNPDNPDHVAFVHKLELPKAVIAETTNRYQQLFHMLTDMGITEYQRDCMGLKI